jgi:hypothetical protein
MRGVWGGAARAQSFFVASWGRSANRLRMAESNQRADTGASFRQCLLELKWMVAMWAIFFAWVIGYSSVAGYAVAETAEVQMVWGIPRWVFFGWLVPLGAANIFTIWFCLFKMQDEPMEELPEEML